jgi:hypothetical protein
MEEEEVGINYIFIVIDEKEQKKIAERKLICFCLLLFFYDFFMSQFEYESKSIILPKFQK